MVQYLQTVYKGTVCEYRYNYYDDSTIWLRNGTLAFIFIRMEATLKRNCIIDIMKEWVLYEKTECDGSVVAEENILENGRFIAHYRKGSAK